MAKTDQILLLNLEQLESLHTQLMFNPDEAKTTIQEYIRKAKNKIDNTYTVEQIKQAVAAKFSMPQEHFTTTKDGNKHFGAKARRFLAVLLSNFTALDRKSIMEICGYLHNSSISLAIQATTSSIQTYKADADLYMEIIDNLQRLKSQNN